MAKGADNPHIDPRIRAMLAALPVLDAPGNVGSREEMLAAENSPDGRARAEAVRLMFEALDNEVVAPSAGLAIRVERFRSEPDKNWINIQVIRPDNGERLPCAIYFHGGAMQTLSCFNGAYRAWGRTIAAQGVAVAMVDFRNAIRASSTPDVAPFPAGLNDCASGVKWVMQNADFLGINARQLIVAGESGGGNLALATGLKLKRDGDLALIKGIYAICPYIAGQWPLPQNPSSSEHNGVLLDLHDNRGAMGYGIEAFRARNPLAWPGFATVDDVIGFPPTVVSVNEFDPLRDEGIGFYRLLLQARVAARCRQIMGTIHGTEILQCCPEIGHDTAADLARFCRN